ncbi:hypothetical protein S40293_09668 [Stachybotrys chartarum IBT 40293]|nr:hypothetical protein S40293_09668 [Stachybotrys chartarum IBT 40293]
MNDNLLTLLALCVASSFASNPAARQDTPVACQGDNRPCGPICIEASWTCCPDGQIGCPANAFCNQGVGGIYSCCPNGSVCEGVGDPTELPDPGTLTPPSFTASTGGAAGATSGTEAVETTTVSVITEDPTSRWEPSQILPPSSLPTSRNGNETLISASSQDLTSLLAPTSMANITVTTTESTTSLSATTTATDSAAVQGFSASKLLGGVIAVLSVLFWYI